MIPEFYPGWNIRLYYDLEDDDPLLSDLCKVACSDSNIDLCYVKDIPALGDVSKVFAMNWRFFPMLDPQVSSLPILNPRICFKCSNSIRKISVLMLFILIKYS